MQNKRTLGSMPEVRLALECIPTGRGDETLYMPVVRVRRKRRIKRKTKGTGRFYQFLRMSLSVLMAVAVYMFMAPLAYMERGYAAYGGECIVAALAGIAVYEALKGVIKE